MGNEDITPELARLIAAHPASFRGVAPEISSHLSIGWFDLVDRLCSAIEAILGTDIEYFECRQIKEKYGGLRFYWYYNRLAAVHVDVAGPAAIETFVNEPDVDDERLLRVSELVSAAVEASESTCETCGAPGRLRVRRGYYMTRCSAHA